MKIDKDFDLVVDEPAVPSQVLQKVERLRKSMTGKIVVKVVRDKKTPKKTNGFVVEDDDSTQEIVDMIAHMAYAEAETKDKPADRYEAWIDTVDASGTKKVKYVRFQINEFGDLLSSKDASETEILLRAALGMVENMGTQNKELHDALLETSKVLRESAMPYKDALSEMGNITANAYKQLAYALFLVMDTQRQDKELEMETEKWKEGMGVIKEFLPKAIKQKIARLGGKDDDEDEDEDEDGDDDDGDDGGEKVERKDEATLVDACQAFGESLEGTQWPKLRKKLPKDKIELIEEIVLLEEGQDERAAEAIRELRLYFEKNPKIRVAVGGILSVQQVGMLSVMIKASKEILKKKRKAEKRAKKKADADAKAASKESEESANSGEDT